MQRLTKPRRLSLGRPPGSEPQKAPGQGLGSVTWQSQRALGPVPETVPAGRALRSALRRHWLASALFSGGLVLRVLTVVSYRPALFYIDTIRYLYKSGGNDPVGYRLPLKLILAIGNFDIVAIVQHLLGLAMALTIYQLLVRRGTREWLAALAVAPVLLDAYQLQMEQMILPDVWFEALIVATIATLLSWSRPGPTAIRAIVAGGLLLGISATFRQVGEILIVPALLYVVACGGGLRAVLARCGALTAAFAAPILVYMTGSYILVGHFYLSHSGVTSTYGRMAWAADCAALRLPAVERGLCPTPAQRAHGPDWLEHGQDSPLRIYYSGPLNSQATRIVASFNRAVLTQQPGRVLRSYVRDLVKLFALSKVTSPGDVPVARWQFRTTYPYLSPHATRAQVRAAIDGYGGGRPTVWRPGAEFLRAYQLGGAYTPGPLLALCVIAGLAGSVLAGIKRYWRMRDLTLACLLFFGSGVALLLMSDAFEFSWRYQLPALVTLPPAGVAAVAALVRQRQTRTNTVSGGNRPDVEALPQASEQVSLRD
jgi:hypothetical protein